MKPSKGRIVLYCNQFLDENDKPVTEELPAIILRLREEPEPGVTEWPVDLEVFGVDAASREALNVSYNDGDSPLLGTWRWPPRVE